MKIFILILFIILWLFFGYNYLVLDYSLVSVHFNSSVFETIFYLGIALFFFLLGRYFPYDIKSKNENVEIRNFVIDDEEDFNFSEKISTNYSMNDDLKIIEGIGPKVEYVLNNSGILTFEDLANSTFDTLSNILNNAGANYKIINPKTWPYQAELVVKKDWDKLKSYQDFLIGGVEPQK